MTTATMGFAVVGWSEDAPVLYHADKTRAVAERLRRQREATVGRPCYVVSMPAWLADPRGALRRAQAARSGGAPGAG